MSMHEKTLEQLVQKLRKALTDETMPWLDELVRRVDDSYIRVLDSTQEKLTTPEDENDPTLFGWVGRQSGWSPISEIVSIEQERVLLFFPYNKNNPYESYQASYERTDLPAGSIYYQAQYGYEVLACRAYDSWVVRAGQHMSTRELSIPLDISGATHFKPFAGTLSHVTREGVLRSNRRLRQQVQELKEVLERKSTELDALGYVWCSGPCAGGQHRYTEPQEITPDMISRIIGMAVRLYQRGANTSKINERVGRWQVSNLTRAMSRITRVGKQRIDFLSQMVTDFREQTNITKQIEPLSVVTYLRNNDDILPNVSGMLAELLAKNIILIDAGGQLCLAGDDSYSARTIPISIQDVPDLHKAASTPGGLWVWVIDHHNEGYKPCGHVVTQLKELGLWKSEWDSLK